MELTKILSSPGKTTRNISAEQLDLASGRRGIWLLPLDESSTPERLFGDYVVATLSPPQINIEAQKKQIQRLKDTLKLTTKIVVVGPVTKEMRGFLLSLSKGRSFKYQDQEIIVETPIYI